jgi:hypothetical protein
MSTIAASKMIKAESVLTAVDLLVTSLGIAAVAEGQSRTDIKDRSWDWEV